MAIRPGDKGDRRVGRFLDNDSLSNWLLSWSAAGYDTYHSCALFGGLKRRANEALGARAFWLDLDVGPDKPFATQQDAAHAVFKFVRDLKLPSPTFVSSGRGLHVYWFVDEFLDVATWVYHAARLKQACVQLGLPADPTRTADIASILRSPGTINQKNGVQVRTLYVPNEGRPQVPAAEIFNVLSTFEPAQRAVAVDVRDRPLIAAAMNIHSYDPPDADTIADACAQVRLLADWPETRAPVLEPVWRGILGVLKHCRDGEEIAHEWSEGHTAYSKHGTQAKIDGWHAGPATCEYFRSHNPGGCTGCPHAGRITSPVQLGRQRDDGASGMRNDGGQVRIPAPTTDAAPEVLTFPPGFYIGGNGELIAKSEDKKGAAIDVVVTRNLVYLDRIARGELRDDRHYYVLKHFTPQDGVVAIEIPAKEFWGNQGVAALAGKGVLIENADLFRLYMRNAAHMQQTLRKTGMMYEQCGWKDNETAFLVGTTLYRATGVESVQGTPEIVYRGRMLGPRSGGSLDGWKRAVDQLFGIGREAQSFALLASFGATLIRFLSTDEGGAIVSLVSRESGRGKTTALAGVSSVWGDLRGLQLSNADTAVARGLTFGALGNIPVIFDELAARDSDVVRDFVEMFTNGRDKMRGTQDGEIKHTLASWQTILITGSNTSLIDTIVAEGGSIATTLRVIELPATLPADIMRVAKQGDALKYALQQNWGYAGDAFTRYLLQPEVLAWAKSYVVHAQQELTKQRGFRPEHRFWARTLACCATAGIMCNTLGLIQFPVAPIITWVLEHLRRKQDIVEKEAPAMEGAVEVLVSFINEHISEMLVCANAWQAGRIEVPRVTPKNKLSLRYNLRQQQLFISERSLRDYCVEREFPFQEFLIDLNRQGITPSTRPAINLGAGTDFASGPQRCLEVNCNHPALGNAAAVIDRVLPTYSGNVVNIQDIKDATVRHAMDYKP